MFLLFFQKTIVVILVRNFSYLTLYLIVSSADNFCKQFGPRSCLKKIASPGSQMFDSDGIPEGIFKKVDFEKNQQMTKKMGKNSQGAKS